MINKKEKLIPIIILNWNGEDDTIECLNSINQSSKSGFITVLIDNGSTPESLERLKNKCKIIYKNIIFLNKTQILNCQKSFLQLLSVSLTDETLVFIEIGENLGFAKGNNIGIKFAELLESEWVLLLNNDTVVLKNTFYNLAKFIKENPSIKAITPQIRYFEPNTKIWNCGGDLTYFGRQKYNFADRDFTYLPTTGFSKITFITGCALLFNYKETGVLSEKYYFGEEDYEFSLRMKKNGFQMVCVYDSIIYHKIGISRKKNYNPLGAIYIYYINRLINTRNYYSSQRWHILKIFSYIYLPILLLKNRINPLKSISLIFKINLYIRCNTSVSGTEYHNSMIKKNHF